MYRVWFTQANGSRDYLDDNGHGFNEDEAIHVAKQLKFMENRDVRIVYIGNRADREEMKGVRHDR